MTDPILPDHALFQDDLKAYADGELSWLRRLAVRRHLTHCASCREEIVQMTQIAEDLRSSDTDLALDPTLRAKILGIAGEEPTPARSSPPLPRREREREQGKGFSESSEGTFPQENLPDDLPVRPLASGGPLRSDLSRSKEVGSRRPALPWLLSGAALLAWFALFPTFQKSRDMLSGSATHSNRVVQPSPQSFAVEKPMYAPAPQAAARQAPVVGAPGTVQTFDMRLSDREAGKGPVVIHMKVPNSQYRDNTNGVAMDAPQRQVHKEATIGVQVPNPETSSDTVETMVNESGGFVANNSLSTGGDGLKTAELTVKVPVTSFEAFLSQVAKLGNVQSKDISGEDITEKTSDADQTESILEDNVQKSEARLKALGSKAKWHDEQATRDLRIQLAQSRARLILLKRMAALSTITVDLSQTPKPATPAPVTGGFVNGLKDNMHDALQSLLSSASALLALVIWLLAYAPIWVPLFFIGRFGLRQYRKRV